MLPVRVPPCASGVGGDWPVLCLICRIHASNWVASLFVVLGWPASVERRLPLVGWLEALMCATEPTEAAIATKLLSSELR
jgi:hypothetical protein